MRPNPGRRGQSSFFLTLPRPGHVRISIFDVTGRLVSRVSDGWRAEGHHVELFDPRGHGAQIYLYRVEWQGLRKEGKCVLLE